MKALNWSLWGHQFIIFRGVLRIGVKLNTYQAWRYLWTSWLFLFFSTGAWRFLNWKRLLPSSQDQSMSFPRFKAFITPPLPPSRLVVLHFQNCFTVNISCSFAVKPFLLRNLFFITPGPEHGIRHGPHAFPGPKARCGGQRHRSFGEDHHDAMHPLHPLRQVRVGGKCSFVVFYMLQSILKKNYLVCWKFFLIRIRNVSTVYCTRCVRFASEVRPVKRIEHYTYMQTRLPL